MIRKPGKEPKAEECSACKRVDVPLEKIASGELDVRVCADWR